MAWRGPAPGVVIVDIAPQEELDALVAELAEQSEAIAIRADVSDEQATKQMAQTVFKRWGRIDGLVNNAVWQPARPFDQ